MTMLMAAQAPGLVSWRTAVSQLSRRRKFPRLHGTWSAAEGIE
jgi:hypothetical protein